MFAECAPWGKSTYSCSDCTCNYERNTETIRGKPDKQKWFRSVLKDPTARVNWFKRNKFCNQPNKKKTFDEAGILEDSSGTRDWSSDIDRYKWLTPEEWIIRVRALGLAGMGTPQQQHQVGLDDYKAKCADKTFPKLCKHGMWLLGVFKGVEHQEGSEESKGRAWKRRKTVDDSQSLNVARTLHAESVADGQAWLRERAQLSSLNFRGSMAQQPGVLSFDVRSQAQPLARQDETPKEIQQGVLHQMRRDMRAKRAEDIDEHEAAEWLKFQKKAENLPMSVNQADAVRPMLTLTELIERASKVREVMIKESQRIKNVLQKAYDGAKKDWEDIVQQVGGKPEEISQDAEEIAKTCKTEVHKAVAVFDKFIADVKELRDKELLFIGDVQVHHRVEHVTLQIRNDFTKKVAPSKASGNKAIAALTRIIKRFKERSQRLGHNEKADVIVPKHLVELLNFVQEAPSGSHGVETLLDICCFPDHDARKACAFPAPAGAVKLLDGIKSIKNHAAWVKRQIEVGNVTTACSQFKPAAVPAILRCLNAESFGCCLSLDWLPEHELPLQRKVFHPQAWATSNVHHNVGVSPFGLGEFRMLLDGTAYVIGVPFNQVPGEDMSAKITQLLTKPEQTVDIIKRHGFAKIMDQKGVVLYVPPGYIQITAGAFLKDDQGATGMRWCFLGKKTSVEAGADIIEILKESLVVYPELKSSGWEEWLHAMANYVLPRLEAAS